MGFAARPPDTPARRIQTTLPDKIRVFHLCDKFGIRGSRTHGVSRLFTWWFPRFDASRFEVRLVGIRPEDEASAHLKRQGLDPICLGRGRFSPVILTDLMRLVRRERPHILHTHGYATSNFARALRARAGVPIIVHEHTAFPSIPSYQRPMDWLLARRTDLGLAVSESTKDFMVRNRFLPAHKIRVVFNGAPLDEFKSPPPARVEAERLKLGLRPGEKIIGMVGRLDQQKGATFFLQAAAEMLRQRRDLRFVIAGDGHLFEQHQEEASALGIAPHTVFAGFCDDVPAFQAVLDVQVFPSLYEGTPLTIFEAMSMRRAIVSTTVDGLKEVLRHGENALLIPPRDAGALAAGVFRLLDHPDLAARLAAQAERDSRRFDIQHTVDELQVLYEQLADGGLRA